MKMPEHGHTEECRCSVTGAEYQAGSFSAAVHSFIAADEEDEAALRRLFAAPNALFQWFSGLLDELEWHTLATLSDGEFVAVFQRFQPKWLAVAATLLNNRFPSEARLIVQRFYQLVRTQEVEKNARFHKGTILYWLGRASNDLGSADQARSEFLLAMIEDVRSAPETWRRLPARDWLVNKFQLDIETVDSIGEAVMKLNKASGWDSREPELTWLHLKPQRRRLSRAPLEFTKAIAGRFFNCAREHAATTKDAGDRLELLMAYLFAVERGFEVVGPTTSPDCQNDILIRNRHDDGAIASLGDYLLVECKNWRKPTGASVVREFAGRLRAAKVKTGVLVSKSGITGQNRRSRGEGARETICKEYQQDSTSVLVLNETDLSNLVSARLKLSLELLQQFETVRFDMR
jgi:hypothetical protein